MCWGESHPTLLWIVLPLVAQYLDYYLPTFCKVGQSKDSNAQVKVEGLGNRKGAQGLTQDIFICVHSILL